ncbi:MAG: transposase family protein [Sulfurimonas sp.]|nr:transposase family protein [Sulfurimonas sp.]MDQ7060664.1 transposase family protein [Sulfurimonas sp.]MDQ7061253.1 transposase family protein [Sulfurimonas sp.]
MAKTRKYYKVNKLENKDFKRIVGVNKDTFKDMVKVIRKHYRDRKSKGGTNKSLSANDEVLLMLEYYREYRTFAHLGIDYGVSESTAHYTVTKIEKILIKEPQFHLETLKHIVPTEDLNNIKITVVDVTESECERPKKQKSTIQVKRKSILKKHK